MLKKSSKKLYIFDLDGTLVDAYRAIEKSLNFTLKKLGYPTVSYSKVKRSVGKGDRPFIQTFFKNKDIDKALDIYRKNHKKTLLVYSKLTLGAKSLLFKLKQRNKIIAIASNRPHYFTNLILKKLGISKYIDGVWCADKVGLRKPHPKIINLILKEFKVKRDEAVYIGDMDIDLETAKRAKISAIFVKNGSSPLSVVRKYKNKKVVSSIIDVIKIYP
ncbi:MAG: HAD family hydrolase [Candidatus Aenigmatarchaeota archaeon]